MPDWATGFATHGGVQMHCEVVLQLVSDMTVHGVGVPLQEGTCASINTGTSPAEAGVSSSPMNFVLP